MGYNSWLRESAQESRNTFQQNTVRLQAQLSAVLSVLQLEETSTTRLTRVSLAMIHLMEELHLLVTLTEEK